MAAESRGKMPPQAMMRLSNTWEMRWMLLWTKMTFSLLFTKSRIVLVEWLRDRRTIKTILLQIQNAKNALLYLLACRISVFNSKPMNICKPTKKKSIIICDEPKVRNWFCAQMGRLP